MQRREFLTLMTGTAIMAVIAPQSQGTAFNSNRKTLVVIELAGGNDGLNTIVPYRDPNYLKLRPTIAIKDALPISDRVALHPALADLKPILAQNRLAIIQNVSYPNPNLSHFRAKDIWQSGQVSGNPTTGWLGRYLSNSQAKTAEAIFLGEEYPLALTNEKELYLQLSPRLAVQKRGKLGKALQAVYRQPQTSALAEQVRRSVLESEAAVQQLTKDIDRRSENHGYAKTAIGKQFAMLGRVLESQPRVIYLTIGGWDTHVGQVKRHQQLLTDLSAGLSALERDIQANGWQKNVLVMVQSEFGRRPAENGSGGTDHGTAGPVLLLGNVRGNLYGGQPALDSLVAGNLAMQVDFRQIYGEILNQWLNVPAHKILGQDLPSLRLFA